MSGLLAIDHGTTRTKALLVDPAGRILGEGSADLPQIYPRPGWVEHDPRAIWEVTQAAVATCMRAAGAGPRDVSGLALDNQGETVVCWDRETGEPVHNAIVWQDRRTAGRCAGLAPEWRERIYRKTGVVLDPYFSATKLEWILTEVPQARALAGAGRLLAGTTDAWLLWLLSGRRLHVTDPSTASRTMLFNLELGDWDDELLHLFGVDRRMLPRVVPTSGACGRTDPAVFGAAVPIVALAVDQQAALFGQACLDPGMVKVTYGTGAFILMQTGPRPTFGSGELVTTVAWRIHGRTDYALDGGVFTAGAAVQWLRDGLGIISAAAETEALARSVPDTGGVYLVPAFAGLAAPHWDPHARGTLLGLTRGTARAHVARAALEGIAYRVRDVVGAMARQSGAPLTLLRADGGATANGFLMQFQADILGLPVEVAARESTALGTALLGGLELGWWDAEQVRRGWRGSRRFEPAMPAAQREALYAGWLRALERARGWDHGAAGG